MKDYYKILNIDRYATDLQIKKAYRELAIRYHPDKTKLGDTHQIFIEINEAYQVLSRKESRENYNFIYDYETIDKKRQVSSSEVYEGPREFSGKTERPYTRTRPVYAKSKDDIDLTPYIRGVRIISGLSFLFTFLIILDFFLPKLEYEEVIQAKLNTYKSVNTVIIATEKHEFPLSFNYSKLIHSGDKAIVSISPIFNIQYKLYVDTGSDKYEFWPHYSIYNIFAFFLIVLLITSYIGLFHKRNNPELVFSAGVANVFLSMLVMYLIFSK